MSMSLLLFHSAVNCQIEQYKVTVLGINSDANEGIIKTDEILKTLNPFRTLFNRKQQRHILAHDDTCGTQYVD